MNLHNSNVTLTVPS